MLDRATLPGLARSGTKHGGQFGSSEDRERPAVQRVKFHTTALPSCLPVTLNTTACCRRLFSCVNAPVKLVGHQFDTVVFFCLSPGPLVERLVWSPSKLNCLTPPCSRATNLVQAHPEGNEGLGRHIHARFSCSKPRQLHRPSSSCSCSSCSS
eukprot:1496022-Rhodomonas_salina.1